MASSFGGVGGRTAGGFGLGAGGMGSHPQGYGYNGQQYPTQQAAERAKNPNPGSREATSEARQAVLGLQGAGGDFVNGGMAQSAPGSGGGFQGPGGGIFTNAGAGSSYSVDAQGNTSYNVTPNMLPQQASIDSAAAGKANEYAMQREAQQAGLSADAFKAKFGLIMGQGGQQGGGTPPPQVQMGASGGEDAANNAAFARAKDIAGSTGRAALNSLNDVMGARGITGSNLAAGEAGGVIGEGARQLGDVNREQLIQSLNQNRAKASQEYQGGIQQRGQDIQAQQQRLQSLFGLLNSGGSY